VNDALAARAEVLKLARVLRRDPDQLVHLEVVPPGDLRALREQVTELLWSDQSSAMQKLASASRLLPVRVAATIGQRAFGPLLAARITGLLDPDRAVEMADTMPVEFLADVATELDPRRSIEVISRIPPEKIAAITRELVRRREFVTMGRFVGHLRDDALAAALSEMDDNSLLQVAFVLESKDNLDHLMSLLGPQRLQGVVDAATRGGLWIEILDLLCHVSARRRKELAQRAETMDGAELASLVHTAAANELWSELLPLVEAFSPPAQQRLAAAVAALEPDQRETIIEGVRAAGMSDQLALLDETLRKG
jgi:hypothetical protein